MNFIIFEHTQEKYTLRAGFEPAREIPIGFQVQRLNHSAITADISIDNESIHNLKYLTILTAVTSFCYL